MRILVVMMLLALWGCAAPAPKNPTTYEQINAELAQAAQEKTRPAQPDAVSQALLPPLRIEMPEAGKTAEPKFDLVVNNAPANQVFMGIVSGTRYSMLVHPEVSGAISVNLKDVSVFEALDAIRELYGYDYKVDGTRIFIQPLTLQTRVFQVNYLTGSRKGTSDIRVTSGSVSDVAPGSSTTTSTTSATPTSKAMDSSKISTTSNSDFWAELKTSLDAIIGNKDGRSIVVSPQSGVVVVHAMPDELRNVAAYLKATQLSVDRQVILEAKILEVQLNDGYQTGINWGAFTKNDKLRFSVGADTRNILLPGGGVASGATLSGLLGSGVTGANGGLLGMAFQTGSFSALVSFLETQGNVHVLSSPRIATLNNQKAVLKVGTDEFFVTNVSSTTTTGTSSTTTPSVTLQPFFSGIALDVTPQIDESGNIILHIHPSVTQVSTVEKQVNLGTAGGTLNLPLASSSVSETDSIVRAQDGQVVAIGGLMKQSTTDGRAQVPGLGEAPVVGSLFRNSSQTLVKSELVILLKPTIIQGNESWNQDILESQRRFQNLTR